MHYILLNPIMWNISSITTNLLSKIGVGLGFTFKNRSVDDKFLFHFNSFFICYNIHLLIINFHLSLVFKFLLGTFHPTIKTFKSFVATPLWGKCENETHTPEIGTWESFRTPKILDFDCRGQNTSHWGILYIIGKLAKCRCWKWPHMGHLDICSTSYGKKKG